MQDALRRFYNTVGFSRPFGEAPSLEIGRSQTLGGGAMEKIQQAMDAVVAAANRHDVTGAGDYLAEDLSYENMAMPQFRGREGFNDIHLALFKGFPDLHYHVVNSVLSGSDLVTECVVTGSHGGEFLGIPPTGKSMNVPVCFITQHDNAGRITRWKTYMDAATVLRQLGAMQ